LREIVEFVWTVTACFCACRRVAAVSRLVISGLEVPMVKQTVFSLELLGKEIQERSTDEKAQSSQGFETPRPKVGG